MENNHTNHPSPMTEQEYDRLRLERRREKNREAAAVSRRKVKERIVTLEKRLQSAQQENSQLRTLLTTILPQVTMSTSPPQSQVNGHNASSPLQNPALAHASGGPMELLPHEFASLSDCHAGYSSFPENEFDQVMPESNMAGQAFQGPCVQCSEIQ